MHVQFLEVRLSEPNQDFKKSIFRTPKKSFEIKNWCKFTYKVNQKEQELVNNFFQTEDQLFVALLEIFIYILLMLI